MRYVPVVLLIVLPLAIQALAVMCSTVIPTLR